MIGFASRNPSTVKSNFFSALCTSASQQAKSTGNPLSKFLPIYAPVYSHSEGQWGKRGGEWKGVGAGVGGENRREGRERRVKMVDMPEYFNGYTHICMY